VFDVIGYLDSRGIDYRESGDNVGSNDVNIDCPFCGETRKHLGIHKSKGLLNCWLCNFAHLDRRPSLYDLIMTIEGCSFREAKAIAKEFSDEVGLPEPDAPPLVKPRRKVSLPEEAETFHSKTYFKAHKRKASSYLSSRGFDPAHLAEKYGLCFCPSGKYTGRIIVPVYYEGELVTYLGRDYLGQSELRYLNCPISESKKSPRQCLYAWDFFDSSHGFVRVVEGVTDVWALDDDCTLALFTNKISRWQVGLLSHLAAYEGVSSLRIALDGDAYVRAMDIASEMSAASKGFS